MLTKPSCLCNNCVQSWLVIYICFVFFVSFPLFPPQAVMYFFFTFFFFIFFRMLSFLAVQNSSIGDLVTDSLTHWVTDFYFWHRNHDHDHDHDIWHIWDVWQIWQFLKQPYRLVTIETLVTNLTIENLNSWQSLLPDNVTLPFSFLPCTLILHPASSESYQLYMHLWCFFLHFDVLKTKKCHLSSLPWLS